MKTSEKVRKVFDFNEERINNLKEAINMLGVCSNCGQIPIHEIEEPFSNCSCGTGEDYLTRPLQILQVVKFYIDNDKEIPEHIKEKVKELKLETS